MYPTYDMNPIAIEHMQRARLETDIRFVDGARTSGPGLLSRLLRMSHGMGMRRPLGALHNMRDPAADPLPDE